MPAATLALAMIVRNEEAHIGTALEHAHRFADWIVIVDTGSIDRTKEICARVADEIIDFEWCDDFAKARNVGLERCTTDFVIWLDADDRVSAETADRIAALMRDPDPAARDWDVLMLPYVYTRDAAGNPTLVQYRERIFRNRIGLRFVFPIHECLQLGPKTRVRDRDDMPVIHNKVAPAESSRLRNLRILCQAVETDEYRNHPRLWRWMAREESAEASIPIYRKIFAEFRCAYPPGVLSEMHVGCARKLLSLNRFDEAREELGLAIGACPAWREPYFFLAQALWFLKRHAEALQVLTLAEGIPPPHWDVIHHNPSIYGGIAFLDWKFFILRSLKRYDEMRVVIRQALAIEPGHARFLKRQRKWGA